jgi:hypothetical protein
MTKITQVYDIVSGRAREDTSLALCLWAPNESFLMSDKTRFSYAPLFIENDLPREGGEVKSCFVSLHNLHSLISNSS